ncbi:MAG: acetylxylan esterase [Pirellulales bacterium]|nr:acetylxylan esterase [Pirellulales bacterium]
MTNKHCLMRASVASLVLVTALSTNLDAEVPNDSSKHPTADARSIPLRTLDSEFPFTPVDNLDAWKARADAVRRQVLLAAGLWPLPTKTPLNAMVHGRVERDDYTVEKVLLESVPGHFVTGNLYRPKSTPQDGKKLPAVLCPHGHWDDGRFSDLGVAHARHDLSIGAERWENAARYHMQARCVQLARMGCVVFHYDMLGYADSLQIADHRPSFPYRQPQVEIGQDQFFSADADARLQTLFGLQTWNSVRSLDFVLSLPEVDSQRVAVTGASGGGTQSMMLSAIDDRIAASFPCVMVSTSMQGGCTCENAPYLRIGMGNVEIAALTAPRPLGLTAANDWTRELRTKGYPDLKRLYELYGHPERLTATFNIHFEHNYNHVSRCTMYGFLNRHFGLGMEEPVLEGDFVPLSRDEMSVWTAEHPKPTGDRVGPQHEKAIRRWMTDQMEAELAKIIAPGHIDLVSLRKIVGGAWETMIGRELPEAKDLDFKLTDKQDRGAYLEMSGLVLNRPAHEELSARFFYPHDWNGEVVLWVTPQGKDGLCDAAGKPIAAIQSLLDAKCSIVAADLCGQGKFTADGQSLNENPMVDVYGGKEAWQHYSAYTYGYNPPLLIRRVRDLMTLVAFVRQHERRPTSVSVVGLAGTGAWVAAARARLGGAIDRAVIDTDGFRFQDIQAQNHADFVPGSVKYGDLPMLVALSAPYALCIAGESKATTDLLSAVFEAAGARENLTIAEPASAKAFVDWLIAPLPAAQRDRRQ